MSRSLQRGHAAGNSCTPWLAAMHGAEEICDLAQLPNAVSHKEREEALSPTALPMFGGFYSFVSFYTHLRALPCRAYPPKAQWDVRMCLCLLFHLRGSLCAWNFGAHPHAFQSGVSVQRQAGAWTDPAGDCLHLVTQMYPLASAAESKGKADTLTLLLWKTSTVLSAWENRAVMYPSNWQPPTEACPWLFVANAEMYCLVKTWDYPLQKLFAFLIASEPIST